MGESNGRSGQKPRIARVDGLAMMVPLALILLLLAFQLVNGYQSALRSAQANVDNLADVLALTITATLDRLHGNLDGLAADVTAADLHAPISADRSQQLEARMAAAIGGFDVVVNHRIFSAEGRTILGVGRGNPAAQFSVEDRAWFRALKDQPERDFVISDVLISRATGRNGLLFAIPLRNKDGTFAGTLTAHIDLDWLQATIDGLDIGAQGLVTLRHRENAHLIVRRPKVEEQLNVARTGLLELQLSSVMRASGEFRSAIDGIDRLYAMRGLGRYPLSLVVAVSPEDYLHAWKVQSWLTGIVALLLGAIQLTAYRRLGHAYHTSVGMAAELEQINTSLKRSNTELEEFAYIASHDLQTPLRNISCFSQLLERRCDGRLDQDCTEFLNFIASNAQRMSGLIHDLLVYARIGRQHMAAGPVAAAEAVALATQDLAADVAACGAQIHVAELPILAVNANHLASLFSNLLSNSLKYRSPDRPLEITISAEPDDNGMWRFAVTDNGIGIAPEYWEKIFAIFQRLHTIDQYEGSGIGLALCRRIVHHWGGTIWVTSKPGEGSTFYFTLPGT